MTRTFTFKANKNAAEHSATVTVKNTIRELPEAVQAALYQDAIANVTIKVQARMRTWIDANQAATKAQINTQAQNYFDEALEGVRRAQVVVTVVQEVVKPVEIDATACGLTKEQIALFSSMENTVLVNVPDDLLEYVTTK